MTDKNSCKLNGHNIHADTVVKIADDVVSDQLDAVSRGADGAAQYGGKAVVVAKGVLAGSFALASGCSVKDSTELVVEATVPFGSVFTNSLNGNSEAAKRALLNDSVALGAGAACGAAGSAVAGPPGGYVASAVCSEQAKRVSNELYIGIL